MLSSGRQRAKAASSQGSRKSTLPPLFPMKRLGVGAVSVEGEMRGGVYRGDEAAAEVRLEGAGLFMMNAPRRQDAAKSAGLRATNGRAT